MSNTGDDRKYLHRENVKVSGHLDALADLASGSRKRKRPAFAPAQELPLDPRVSTTPILQAPRPAFESKPEPITGDSADGFFGDFGADDAPTIRQAQTDATPPSSRGDVFLPSGLVDDPEGAIDFDPNRLPEVPAASDKQDTNNPLAAVSQDTPANGSKAPQPPAGEAIDEVLDGFNW
jgi:hypothetical protein